MSTIRRHVVVVGAGIFGVSTARELTARGARVTVCDPGPVPRPLASSTDRSKVVRMDYGRDRFLAELAERSLEGWRRWNDTLFDRPLFHEVGFLLLTEDPMAPGGFEYDSFRTLEAMGHPVERIDPSALARRFGAWNPDRYRDGYLSRHAGWVESGEAVRQLAARAEAEGVVFRAARVEGLLGDDAGVTGVAVEGGRIQADSVVVAAGAWSPALLPGLRGLLRPVAMPVVLLRPRDPAAFRPPAFPVWGADISRTGWYGFPAGPADGIVKIGHHGRGRVGDPATPPPVPESWVERVRDFARESLPGLVDASLVSTRSCFYCDARDGDFWIAADPDRPGLVVATGGSGHGFKFGPVLGELVADAVEGTPGRGAERFRWRPEAAPDREHARFDGS